ncbi:hypothetical protein B484DRAFT_398054 [Ochromonadaceae sp. CCMP2298]|nr:hypothetical protein B484DRAFT_398054 [Ochromonadaceae sp. CCMP2298]
MSFSQRATRAFPQAPPALAAGMLSAATVPAGETGLFLVSLGLEEVREGSVFVVPLSWRGENGAKCEVPASLATTLIEDVEDDGEFGWFVLEAAAVRSGKVQATLISVLPPAPEAQEATETEGEEERPGTLKTRGPRAGNRAGLTALGGVLEGEEIIGERAGAGARAAGAGAGLEGLGGGGSSAHTSPGLRSSPPKEIGLLLAGMVGVTFVGATVLLVPKTKAVQEALDDNIIEFRTSAGKRERAENEDGQDAGSRGGSGAGARGARGVTGDGTMYMDEGGIGEYAHDAPTNPAQHVVCYAAAQPRHQAMDLDNNPIKCLATASAVERYQGLAVVGRLMSAEKRKLVCPEWLLQLTKLAQLLEQCRSSRPGGIGGGDFSSFQGVKDLDKMGVMVKGVTKDSPFESALRGLDYDAHNWTKFSVLHFLDSESTKSISFAKGECGWLGRQLVERSLLYHGQFWSVLCSEELGRAADALRQSLVKDTHVWERFDDVQILFQVCKMLANWYFELSSLQESMTFEGVKMDTPLKCAKLLELGCNDLVTSATKVDTAKGWCVEAQFAFYRTGGDYERIKHASIGGEVKPPGGKKNAKEGGAAQRPGAGKGQGPGKGPGSGKKEVCAKALCTLLGVRNLKGEVMACRQGGTCTRRHPNKTADVSKEDALEAASSLQGEVSKLLQAAISNSAAQWLSGKKAN